MSIFAIGDLHLSKSGQKPMDIFGSAWKNHDRRICESWLSSVTDEDIVLVPGDLSWAMQLEEAYNDLYDIMSLPGKKVFIRGNHDYWWNGIGKVRSRFSEFSNAFFLQNDSVAIDGIGFAGTRGWTCPESSEYKKTKDEAIYKRELYRLEMSLNCLPKDLPKVVLIHFPPFVENDNEVTELFKKYGVNNVVYGHLHGTSTINSFSGTRDNVQYDLCSADGIGFVPKMIQLNIEKQIIGE